MSVNLQTRIGSLEMKNPIMTASGTCGYGEELAPFIDIASLGALIPKSISVLPRLGNKNPRLAETSSGLLNSIGLQNEGLELFIKDKLPRISTFGCPIVVNIAGFSISDFTKLTEVLDEYPQISGFEVNISCPNVKKGGFQFGTDPQSAIEVTKAVRKATDKTVILKLTPNVTDITSVARAVENAGADAVSLINTLSAIAVDAETRKSRLGNLFGGLSGPAVKPVALRMVHQVFKAVQIPVIGLGGIRNGIDAIEFMICGATAVQIGTANLTQPASFNNILSEITDYCKRHSISNISELTGTLIA